MQNSKSMTQVSSVSIEFGLQLENETQQLMFDFA